MKFHSLESMKILCQTHMNIRQAAVMTIVYSNYEPCDFGDLKRHLGIPGSALNRALDFLLIKKLIRSRRNELDGRRVFILRTPEGEEFLRKITT